MHKNNPGFTLVELLIVIVIIAILASLSIVAYNGITERARVSIITSDLSGIGKKLEFYKVDHGVYPASYDTAYRLVDSPLTKQAFSSDDDSTYRRVLYCSNGQDYIMVASIDTSPQRYFIVGKAKSVSEIVDQTVPGASNDICDMFMESPPSNFTHWVKGASGWSPELR